ncbi:MAG: hypothetical protein H6553_07050 [Chitinophagales bacterium]|nr:hypothetical protein [Chitinophagales bacterium]
MVTINMEDNKVVFTINGLHKLWTLKSKIEVDKSNIVSVYQDEKELNEYKGLRFPGTAFPFVIYAGTFIKKKQRNFWDVLYAQRENAIIVELKNEKYNKLYIQVQNPIEAIHLLQTN